MRPRPPAGTARIARHARRGLSRRQMPLSNERVGWGPRRHTSPKSAFVRASRPLRSRVLSGRHHVVGRHSFSAVADATRGSVDSLRHQYQNVHGCTSRRLTKPAPDSPLRRHRATSRAICAGLRLPIIHQSLLRKGLANVSCGSRRGWSNAYGERPPSSLRTARGVAVLQQPPHWNRDSFSQPICALVPDHV